MMAMTPSLASLGRPWRPNKATTGTLLGWYEVFDATVTRVSGDASNVANLVTGGANPLVQANSLNRGTYGATLWGGAQPAIDFDGISDCLEANGLAAAIGGTDQPFTLQMLCQILTLGSAVGIRSLWGFGRSTDDNPLHDIRLPASTTGVINSARRDSAGASKLKDAATAVTTSRMMLSLVFNGTKTALYVNGTLDANLDGASSTADNDVGVLTGLDRFTVGALTRTIVSGNVNLRLAALLLYSGGLSGAEVARNEHYVEQGHPL